MEESKCVKEDKRSVYDCLKDEYEADVCRAQRNAYTMCVSYGLFSFFGLGFAFWLLHVPAFGVFRSQEAFLGLQSFSCCAHFFLPPLASFLIQYAETFSIEYANTHSGCTDLLRSGESRRMHRKT